MVCFMQFVRRNNDCEEWHYSVNKIAHVSRMNFYELVEELYDIALDIPMERERDCSKRDRGEFCMKIILFRILLITVGNRRQMGEETIPHEIFLMTLHSFSSLRSCMSMRRI